MATEKKIPATQQPLPKAKDAGLNEVEVKAKKKAPAKKAPVVNSSLKEADVKQPEEVMEVQPSPAVAVSAEVKEPVEAKKVKTEKIKTAKAAKSKPAVEPAVPAVPTAAAEEIKDVKEEKKKVKKAATAKKETAVVPEKIAKAPKKASPKKKEATIPAAEILPVREQIVAEQPVVKAEPETTVVKLVLELRFHTKFGQHMYITGNHAIFGNNEVNKALAMQYVNNDLWSATLEVDKSTISDAGITYNYMLQFPDGITSFDWGSDKVLTADLFDKDVYIRDSWNHAGFYENVFYTEPFMNVLFKENYTQVKTVKQTASTHLFKVKAPLLAKGQTVCITGSDAALGNWNEEGLVLMGRKEYEDQYTAYLDLAEAAFPVVYKYGVYDTEAKKFVRHEDGADRLLYAGPVKNALNIINDGFIVLPNDTWKGAGVSVPVFSLRSEKSFGTGEFTDLKLLVDWAKKTGLKLIQILPVNDTTATYSWVDSYPYAAISAFALHPMYLNLSQMADASNQHLVEALEADRIRLNKLDKVDYQAVNNLKWQVIKEIYPLQKAQTFASEDYKAYFAQNSHWLTPYAAFSYLRDQYQTADFSRWPSHKNYRADEIAGLVNESEETNNKVALYYFIQYHLHLQLKAARDYAHENAVIIKGDIPIGVYRYGADAWQQPELYNMHLQAGAPPDNFAVKGQNWGFPTYNWDKMKQDGFAWWRKRFEQMSYYFDSFRIDHILGFFRIWSIPYHSVEGIMGHFEPSIPVYLQEFYARGIAFDYNRFCKPFITDKVLNDTFGDQQDYVRGTFLTHDGAGNYYLKPEFATQRQIEEYFAGFEQNPHNYWLKQSLFNVISSVILFEADGSNAQQFHFRYAMDTTLSFKALDANTQHQLKDLYLNYFFGRQDDFWKLEAMQKLPALKRVTNMLVCGEDLGFVVQGVKEVMNQLGILSMEIQRMPKDSNSEFYNLNEAPYLSVATPSTHDTSTLRAWWEEDRDTSQKFYNTVMGQRGYAPYLCDAWVNKAIVLEHLYSPAMWSIFQVQDLLGINSKIRKEDPNEERINIPANPQHYWRYRMHITLEYLLKSDDYNNELLAAVQESGRHN